MVSVYAPLTLVLIGVIVTIIGYYTQKQAAKQHPKVVYKFITQNLDEEDKVIANDVYNEYSRMFTDKSLL